MLFYSDNIPYEKIGNDVHSLADYAPFEIPETWEWCRVGDLFTNMSGLSYKKELLDVKTDRMIRVMRGGNIGDERYCYKPDDVFISNDFVKPELFLKKNYMITPAVSSLEHIGKIALIEDDLEDTVVGGFVLMLIPLFNDDIISKYLLYAFAAKNHRDNCRNITHKSGQAFYNLSRELLMNLPVPLPPHSEMKRIIAKLEEVLPFVDTYDTVDRESCELNRTFPENLKKAILQWAVQGKLVPQDENDEPAEVLLERIRVEKEALIKAGKIKRDKHESVIFRRDNSHYEKRGTKIECIDDEIPFEIPSTWTWERLGNIGETNIGLTYSPSDKVPNGGTIVLRSSNIQHGQMSYDDIVRVSCEIPERAMIAQGDILICARNGSRSLVGKSAIVDQDGMAFGAFMAKYSSPFNLYIQLFIESPAFRGQLEGVKTETINQITQDMLKNQLCPIPPLAEQKRIVDCVKILTSLCKKI